MSRLITLSHDNLPPSLRKLVGAAARVRDVVVNEDFSSAFYMDADLNVRQAPLDAATQRDLRLALFAEEVVA